MERIMSPEERMRRAEEIYYRRQSQGIRVSTNSVNVGKTNKVSLGKKMIIQIVICVIIYSIFYFIKGYDNIFSQNVISTTKSILNYDVNFANLYNQAVEYFNSNFNNIIKNVNVQNEETNGDNTNVNGNSSNENSQDNNSENNQEHNSNSGSNGENETQNGGEASRQ